MWALCSTAVGTLATQFFDRDETTRPDQRQLHPYLLALCTPKADPLAGTSAARPAGTAGSELIQPSLSLERLKHARVTWRRHLNFARACACASECEGACLRLLRLLRMVRARCAAEQYPALFTHVFDGTKQLGKLMAILGRNNIATMG
jgi:hypothetical protein